ncbi:hypothetical protein A2U01_0059540 [Trifolium medium]|uniref:Uncharacterized protein n=1 Tax=Trifolium medium TaxID=97028 RepID=A0A392RQ14_9FABA|nr:hypothetical protein [Trifolium medium]
MSTSADGVLWSKRSRIPSGMGEAGSNPAFNSFSKLTIFNAMDNPYESGFSFTLSDFKLGIKDGDKRLCFKKSGIKERTYATRYDGELESV